MRTSVLISRFVTGCRNAIKYDYAQWIPVGGEKLLLARITTNHIIIHELTFDFTGRSAGLRWEWVKALCKKNSFWINKNFDKSTVTPCRRGHLQYSVSVYTASRDTNNHIFRTLDPDIHFYGPLTGFLWTTISCEGYTALLSSCNPALGLLAWLLHTLIGPSHNPRSATVHHLERRKEWVCSPAVRRDTGRRRHRGSRSLDQSVR